MAKHVRKQFWGRNQQKSTSLMSTVTPLGFIREIRECMWRMRAIAEKRWERRVCSSTANVTVFGASGSFYGIHS